MSSRPASRTRNVFDQIRAVLKAQYGYDDAVLDELPESQLAAELYIAAGRAESHAEAKAELPRWIRAGYLSKDDARDMSPRRSSEFRNAIHALGSQRKRLLVEPTVGTKTSSVSALPRGEVVSLFAELLAVVAAQQSELDELRALVATQPKAHPRKPSFERAGSATAAIEEFAAHVAGLNAGA